MPNTDTVRPLASLDRISSQMESKTAYEVLRWALEEYERISLASSFGAEDVVIIDMMARINKKKCNVFTLDTGRLNQETYDVIDAVRKKYDINVKVYFPDYQEVEKMVLSKGLNLMYESLDNRLQCCHIRKVVPLRRALSNLDAWITGLRREQAITRSDIKKVEIDTSHNNIIKINPIADWDSKMLWDYINKNQVPYNKLHDVGYPSIGCEPCTRAVEQGQDPRSGRWWWEDASKKECGLHLDHSRLKR